jgi:hypothetical protein
MVLEEPLLKKSKSSAVNVPPQLMKIVHDAADSDENVTTSLVAIQSKALRALDSYIHCVCMRVF